MQLLHDNPNPALFTMNNEATISGNKADWKGGGVALASPSDGATGRINKTGGIIYGNDADDQSNVALDDDGHAVCVLEDSSFTRNDTLDLADDLVYPSGP